MLQLQHEIEIHAPDHLVWQVITDFKNHSAWSGWKGSVSGKIKEGALLRVISRQRPGKAQLSFFKVIRVVDRRELRWVVTYIPFGLLRGERFWILKKLGDNKTKLIHGEAFMGLLLGISKKHLAKQGNEVFSKISSGLKQYCEGLVSQS